MASSSSLFFLALVSLLLAVQLNASSALSASNSTSVTSSLVAWWKLDERMGQLAADSSGNRATGLLKGTGTFGGVVFDGQSYIAMGTKPSLFGETDFTVQAWVWIPSSVEADYHMCIIQQRGEDIRGEWWLWIVNGTLQFLIYDSYSTYQFNIRGTVPLNDGVWHHVVAVREGKVGSIYVDSKLDKSQAGESVVSLNADLPVYIGFDPRDDKLYFKGSIKEVQIFNAAVLPKDFKSELRSVTIM